MQIARNVCIDQWRKCRAAAELEETDRSEAPAAGKPGASPELRLALEKLWTEMSSLPTEQRCCLEMKIEGYSYEETAARTGLSLEAVKSHLQNGRRMLWLKMEGAIAQLK